MKSELMVSDEDLHVARIITAVEDIIAAGYRDERILRKAADHLFAWVNSVNAPGPTPGGNIVIHAVVKYLNARLDYRKEQKP